MAEAVGLVASIATLAKIVVKTGELTLTYKHAPRELQVLKSGLIGLDSDLRRLEEFCKKVPERYYAFNPFMYRAVLSFRSALLAASLCGDRVASRYMYDANMSLGKMYSRPF